MTRFPGLLQWMIIIISLWHNWVLSLLMLELGEVPSYVGVISIVSVTGICETILWLTINMSSKSWLVVIDLSILNGSVYMGIQEGDSRRLPPCLLIRIFIR